MQSAATFAQDVLTELAGDTAGFTIAGDSTTYYGVGEVVEHMEAITVNGFETRKTLQLAPTKTQFTNAPSAASRPKITFRSQQWVLIGVRAGPLHYHLTCVAA